VRVARRYAKSSEPLQLAPNQLKIHPRSPSEPHIYGMRGKHARIVALELPLSHARKRRAVIEAGERVGVPVVPHRSLKAVALDYGAVLQPSLRPKKTLTRAANVWARNGPV
jgi:hypothetical protein